MNASKEHAESAMVALMALSDGISESTRTKQSGNILMLQEFLQAARRKLPSEAAYERDKCRKGRNPATR